MSLTSKTDKEVYDKVDQSPINQFKAMVEMMIRLKRSMENNIKAIQDFNNSNSEQTKEVIKLTKWLLYLTIAIGLLAILQLISIVIQNN